MPRKLPLPEGWICHMKSSVLQILSLAHYCFSTVRGWAAESRALRLQTRRGCRGCVSS